MPMILAFDTSAAHCAAALLCGADIVATRTESMSRGQAERLMPLLEEVLSEGGANWRDLDAIGVGVGPGNFTGIRISVAAARGLALGLNIPAVGVDGFDARADRGPRDGQIPCIPAPRERVYIRPPGQAPTLLPRHQAEALANLFEQQDPAMLVQAIARIAAQRWRDTLTAPSPVYVRPADAAPSRDQPPALLDE